MVLVLDALVAPERGDGEARDVAGGEHVLAPARVAVLVDDDPVVHFEPGWLLRDRSSRMTPEAGNDAIRLAGTRPP